MHSKINRLCAVRNARSRSESVDEFTGELRDPSGVTDAPERDLRNDGC